MGILEQIKEMKNKGISEEEIVAKLQEQRISPKQINDALSQSKIKEAVADEDQMQPSIMQTPPKPNSEEDIYVPHTKEMPEPENYSSQEYTPQYQEYSPQGGYGETSYIGTDTETMIEISEQVFSEKIKKMQNKLDELNEFKTLAQVKIDNTSERLKRMENIIDNLQVSILEKVGNYGSNLNSIKKEMTMMQDSFKKLPKTTIPLSPSKTAKKISKV